MHLRPGSARRVFPVLPCEAAVPPLPQHDRACTPAHLRETAAAGEPTLEPAPEGTEEPEERSHHGGQDQHLGSLHARAAYTPTGPSRQPTTRRTAAPYERVRGDDARGRGDARSTTALHATGTV